MPVEYIPAKLGAYICIDINFEKGEDVKKTSTCVTLKGNDTYCAGLIGLREKVFLLKERMKESGYFVRYSPDAKVLLCGETFTNEEVWMRFVHEIYEPITEAVSSFFTSISTFFDGCMKETGEYKAYNRKIGAGHYGVHF